MAMAMSLLMPSSIASPSSLPKSQFHGIQISLSFPIRICVASSYSATVMMSKKVEEIKELRSKTNDEINSEVVELKGELFMLRLQRAARNDFKQSEFRRMRKRIARLLTIKRERELEEGINKRLSRKLDREWRKSIVPRPPPSLVKLKEEEAEAGEAA